MARSMDDDTFVGLALLGAGVISLIMEAWWPVLLVATWAIGFAYMQGRIRFRN